MLIAELMSSYWVSFAAKGDPNGKGLPRWPAVSEKPETTMQIGDGTNVIRVAGSAAKVEFWKQYFARLSAPGEAARSRQVEGVEVRSGVLYPRSALLLSSADYADLLAVAVAPALTDLTGTSFTAVLPSVQPPTPFHSLSIAKWALKGAKYEPMAGGGNEITAWPSR